MDFAAYARALGVLEAFRVRQVNGTAESVDDLLRAHADLAEILSPMLAAVSDVVSDRENTQADVRAPAFRGLPEPGESIGGYRIERMLGQGGMGMVFLAEDTRLVRKVALKLVRPERVGSPAARERFWREAKLAARLEHPNICPVYEVGEAQGVPFMAMRFLAGETLAARLASKANPPRADTPAGARTDSTDSLPGRHERKRIDDLIAVVETVARALHFAHERGVVHRDVKPANIVIEPDGAPMVLDFGMARGADDDLALTMTGELAGTPLYMAPEQVEPRGRGADARADVFALGVTLYEAVAGVRPFTGQSMRELLDAIVHSDPPPIGRRNALAPRDLDVVVEKALEKDLDRRYRSAAELADDLARVRAHQPVLARRASLSVRAQRWMQRNPGAVAVLGAAIVALAVMTWLYLRGEASRRDFALVSLVRRFDELRERERPIYARWPDHEGDLRALIADVERWRADVAGVEPALARLGRATPEGLQPPTESAPRFVFETLRSVVRNAAAIERPAGLRPRLQRNLAALEAERARAAGDADVWVATAAAVRASARYGELALRPQLGLVPLGADPTTGLFEFAHPRSGALPVRNAEGRWQIGEDTGMVFVLLPGGTFWMGAQAGKPDGHNYDAAARLAERPPHEVVLAPFFLSKYEVTQAQWMRLYGGDNPAEGQPGALGGAIPFTLAHPVEMVTWNECQLALSQAGLTLPTEAQWEYAARAATETPWWAGSDLDALHHKINLADRTALERGAEWFELDGRVVDGFIWHAPVDALAPNGFGLYGVSGNVWEWCLDAYVSYKHPARAGDGLRGTGDGQRVLRGGAFDHAPVHARSAMRRQDDPATRSGNLGLRAARAVR